MDIIKVWNKIRNHFSKSFSSSLHVSVASVDIHNNPTSTPIGSLFLNADQTGFYFEKFPTKLPARIEVNNKICVLGVNSNKWFWIKSLYKKEFRSFPAIKLYGKLGEKRKASAAEIYALERRMRMTRRLKGHEYLWGSMDSVREVSFSEVEKINLGSMTSAL